MRKIAAILATLALATSADAKPRRQHKPPTAKALASAEWVRDCVHERDGDTDGLSVPTALKLCKAMRRVHDAIEACHLAVIDACLEQEEDRGKCSDAALAAEFAATCFPKPDRVTEGK